MQSVNSTFGLGLVVARLFNTLNTTRIIDSERGVSLPVWQESSKGISLNFKSLFIILIL